MIYLAVSTLLLQSQHLVAQSAGAASLQTAAPTPNSAYSAVPIVGMTV